MAPVIAGMIKMESLYDGELNLDAFAIANDALALKVENERRAMDAARAEGK